MKVVYKEEWLNNTAAYSFPLRDIRGDKNPMKNKQTAKLVGKKLSILGKDRMSKMTAKEKSEKYGNHGTNNPMFGQNHTPETKSKISLKVKEGTQHNKIECRYCSRLISKINMSRHLYSCTDGKEGTKGNPTRKGIKHKNKKVALK